MSNSHTHPDVYYLIVFLNVDFTKIANYHTALTCNHCITICIILPDSFANTQSAWAVSYSSYPCY